MEEYATGRNIEELRREARGNRSFGRTRVLPACGRSGWEKRGKTCDAEALSEDNRPIASVEGRIRVRRSEASFDSTKQ